MTNVLQRDMEKIRMAIDQTDGAEFERVVDTIIGARASTSWASVRPRFWQGT